MAWRVIEMTAALLLIGGVLGVSTGLVNEVQDAVLEAEQPEPEIEFAPPEETQPGIPLASFTLLDPALAELPGAPLRQTSWTLEEPGTLHLEEGDRLEPDPFPLPSGTEALFPEGAASHPNGIECPQGCQVKTRTTFAVPPGGVLEISPPPPVPPDPGQRLTLQEGGRLHLDPIPASSDTELPLPPATTLDLPSPLRGSQTSEDLYEVPAGTHLAGPPSEVPDAASMLQDRPQDGPGTIEAPSPTDPLPSPNITIDAAPATLTKDTQLHLEGSVHLPGGTPLSRIPITVTANRTPQAPGHPIQIGTVASGPDGSFNATVKLDKDLPAQPYHLVARTHAQPDHEPPVGAGTASEEIPLEGITHLEVEAPTKEGIQNGLPIQAHLVDEHDAPVPNQPLLIEVPGDDKSLHARTGSTGKALLILEEGLPSAGEWTIKATYQGTDHLTSSTATTTTQAVHERISTPARITIERGTNTTLEGRILSDEDRSNMPVKATMLDRSWTTTTDSDGFFALPLQAAEEAPLGNHSLVLRSDPIPHDRTIIATITGQAHLHTDPPTPLPRGGTLPLHVQATTETGAPAPQLPLQARTQTSTLAESVTDHAGKTTLPIPLEDPVIDVDLVTPGTQTLAGNTTSVTLRTQPLGVEGTLTATIGAPHESTLSLDAGRPLAHEPARVVAPGIDEAARTDANGTMTLPLEAPTGTSTGPHQAKVHLPRFDLTTPAPVNVRENPHLEVTVRPTSDGSIPVHVNVTGSQGPLAGVPLTAEATGAFSARASGITDDHGQALIDLERPSNVEGEATIEVSAEATGHTATTSEQATVSVASSGPSWLFPLALLPLVGMAAWVATKKARSDPASTTPEGPHIELRLAPQRPSWPPVWHAGDGVDLEIRLRDETDRPLAEKDVELTGPGGSTVVTTDHGGSSKVRLPSHEEGNHAYRARFEGPNRDSAAEARLVLRIVDYEEAIDREYQDFRERAIQAGIADSSMTPRELAQQLPSSGQARRMIRLFQRCVYSPRKVTREDYERFMRAKEACLPDAQSWGG